LLGQRPRLRPWRYRPHLPGQRLWPRRYRPYLLGQRPRPPTVNNLGSSRGVTGVEPPLRGVAEDAAQRRLERGGRLPPYKIKSALPCRYGVDSGVILPGQASGPAGQRRYCRAYCLRRPGGTGIRPGDVFGMIKFGSRTELYLPLGPLETGKYADIPHEVKFGLAPDLEVREFRWVPASRFWPYYCRAVLFWVFLGQGVT
jgi:hypothetical protein